MSQISPPIRVLLVAAVAFLAAWMLFLRPSAEPVPEPVADTPVSADPAAADAGGPANPASAPGRGKALAEDAAQRATKGASEADAKAQGLVGEDAPAASRARAGKVAPPLEQRAVAPELDAATLAMLPDDVAGALRRHEVLVLLFYNPRAADDRAVRRELRGVDRWDGRVFVDAVPAAKLARYAPITRGVDVVQSPTVVVVDRALKAETLVGFHDRLAIDQAVLDALRNTDVLVEDRYLRAVNRECRRVGDQFLAEASSLSELRRTGVSGRRKLLRLDSRLRSIAAPRKWRAFKRATLADHAALLRILDAQLATLTPPVSAADARRNQALLRRSRGVVERYDRRMDRHHVLSCGRNA